MGCGYCTFGSSCVTLGGHERADARNARVCQTGRPHCTLSASSAWLLFCASAATRTATWCTRALSLMGCLRWLSPPRSSCLSSPACIPSISQCHLNLTGDTRSHLACLDERLNVGGAVVPISLAGQESRCWEMAYQGDYESQAEDPSLVHVAPAMHGSLSQAPELEFLTAAPTLPQMPAAWSDPMGVSDRHLETTAFDGRVSHRLDGRCADRG